MNIFQTVLDALRAATSRPDEEKAKVIADAVIADALQPETTTETVSPLQPPTEIPAHDPLLFTLDDLPEGMRQGVSMRNGMTPQQISDAVFAFAEKNGFTF